MSARCTAGQKPGRTRWPGLASLSLANPQLVFANDEGWIMKRLASLVIGLAVVFGAAAPTAHAAPKKEFNIAWTIYVGWMPWPYAVEAGIVKKWADKYGITITVTQINRSEEHTSELQSLR